jgi:hypothetical protein
MEKFWAVILIFVVVAAAGLMYVNQVYNPQKETQIAMANMANQTLSAVKAEIGDGSTLRNIKGDQVADSLSAYVQAGETIDYYFGGANYSGDIDDIISHVDLSAYYDIEVEMEEGKVTEIRITEK